MAQSIKYKLGKFKRHTFVVPDLNGIMEHTIGESLMLFGLSKLNEKNYRQVYGVGRIYRISKGEKFDVVYMGYGLSRKWRKIIVMDNFARRQIMTLKKGHIASFYGYSKMYAHNYKGKDGLVKTKQVFMLFALGFLDWYVPRQVEIDRDYADNEDVKVMSGREEKYMENFLDQFELTKGEEND